MVKPGKKLKKTICVLGITGAVYVSFKYLLSLVIPFLIAYIIAAALRPPAVWLEERSRFRLGKRTFHIPASVTGGAMLLLILTALGLILYVAGRKFCVQVYLLSDNLPLWVERFDRWLTGACVRAEGVFGIEDGYLVAAVRLMLRQLVSRTQDAAMPFLMVNSVSVINFIAKAFLVLVVIFMAVMLLFQEMDELREKRTRSVFRTEYALLGKRLVTAGNAYLKTQLTITFVTTCLCILGFIAIGNPYHVLLGITVGLLDALPLFGTGTVLVPWGIFLLAQREWVKAGVLLGLYFFCYVIREYLEVHLMGEQVGLSGLETLMSIYIGLNLFGLLGLILGPVGLIIIKDLLELYCGGDCVYNEKKNVETREYGDGGAGDG